MRFLLVIEHDPGRYPPTLNAARVLASAGAEVLCLAGNRLSSDSSGLTKPGEIRYHRGNRGCRWPLSGFLDMMSFRSWVVSQAKGFRPHVVIGYDHGGGWAVLPLLRQTSVVGLLHIHDNLPSPRYFSLRRAGLQWTAVRAEIDRFRLVVVPEQQRAEHLSPALPGVRFHVSANAPPRTAPVRNSKLRDLLGLDSDRTTSPLAVAVGNMGMQSEVVRALSRTRVQWHVVFIGSGRSMDSDRTRADAARVGVLDRVHLIPQTPYDTLREWLLGCDIGLALYPPFSSSDVNWRLMGTASVKVHEYMAAGLPSVVWSPEAFRIFAKETGALFILEGETHDDVRLALDRLEPSGPTWRRLADAAQIAHSQRYNAECQLDGVLRAAGV